MKPYELRERAEAGEVVGDGREQIAALVDSIKFTQQWYAVRWERLRELLRQAPELEKQACCIMANGVTGNEPPTYAIQMNQLRHRIKQLESK